jgi:hypothetical protein
MLKPVDAVSMTPPVRTKGVTSLASENLAWLFLL